MSSHLEHLHQLSPSSWHWECEDDPIWLIFTKAITITHNTAWEPLEIYFSYFTTISQLSKKEVKVIRITQKPAQGSCYIIVKKEATRNENQTKTCAARLQPCIQALLVSPLLNSPEWNETQAFCKNRRIYVTHAVRMYEYFVAQTARIDEIGE